MMDSEEIKTRIMKMMVKKSRLELGFLRSIFRLTDKRTVQQVYKKYSRVKGCQVFHVYVMMFFELTGIHAKFSCSQHKLYNR